jgi:DNA primase
MARIPNDQLERIKQEVSLLRLAEGQGYQLQKQGKDYAVCCPFHDDKTPSCIISPKSNLFNCFGCGTGGSVIDWVMKTQGVSFRHAVEILRDDSSLAATAANTKPIKQATIPKLEAPITTDAEDQKVLQQVIDYYHQTLKQSPEALAYLQQRGLDDPELINHFKLGYANRTLGLRLPQKNRQAGKAMREQLQRIGLYRETGREHFNGSIVFPVIDTNGIIGEVYGRKIRDDLRKGTPKHTYLPNEHSGVFNAQALINTSVAHGVLPPETLEHPCSSEIILCECIIDALTFWRWGFRHVTCSYGTNGFTDEILQALIDNKVKRVLIAYDRDEAGNTAAEKLAPTLLENGIDAFRILLPKNMDVNQYALQVTPAHDVQGSTSAASAGRAGAVKRLALVIRKAEWLGNGKVPDRSCASMHPRHTGHPDHKRQLELTELQTKNVDPQDQERSDTSKTPIKPASNEQEEIAKLNPIDQAASPLPLLAASVDVQTTDTEIFITLGDRVYRVRGLANNNHLDQLKINLMVKREEAFHLDKLDLYSSKQRQVFINQACVELGVKDEVIKKDLGKVLLALEEQQAQQQEDRNEKSTVEIDSESRKAAMELLHDPLLLDRVLSDFKCAGVVGEETNKLAGYLSCVSRKLDKPLAVIIQSSSAAGKSSLMDSILALMPEEERVQYSAMTGQSLFYMGETNLKNKILAIAEEEGASNASYSLKLLQSEGEITMASTGKDDSTGNLVTKEYKVQGPVMLFLTTTAIDIDEELMNRCLVLSVNESREQTQAIHAAQRSKRTLQGLQNKIEKERVVELHRNAQRLLKPLQIINPYADQLTFLDDKTRTRRDHEKYLTLIDAIALLHQYQREVKTVTYNGSAMEYIEVTLSDIETANRLAHEILGRTLDELPPQTRKLLKEIQQWVKSECEVQTIEQNHFRFSRKEIREKTQWGNTQLKVHLRRLEDMEYVLTHRGGRGQSFEYELLYDNNKENNHHLMGLLDTEKLTYDKKKSGVNAKKAVPSRPQVGGVSGLVKSLQGKPVMAYSDSGSVSEKCTSRGL